MQMKERSLAPGLPEVLDQALARLQAGESVEACLDAYPQHATVLEPLLRAGDLLNAQAAISLPPEMDTWLATGAHDFAAIAAQLAPKYTKPLQTTRPSSLSTIFSILRSHGPARARRSLHAWPSSPTTRRHSNHCCA
jgi:hypothetical protein